MTAPSPEALPPLIADTYALLWYLVGDHRLGQNARTALENVDAGRSILVIPAVVLAELFMVVERGRLALSAEMFEAALRVWQQAKNIRFNSLTPELVIASAYLSVIPDIFDRLIVAEARALNAPVITRDPIISNSQLVVVIW